MSSTIKAAIQALKGRIADAYTAIVAKGGTLPATQDSASLPAAIASIPSGGIEYYVKSIAFQNIQSVTEIDMSSVHISNSFSFFDCEYLESIIGLNGEITSGFQNAMLNTQRLKKIHFSDLTLNSSGLYLRASTVEDFDLSGLKIGANCNTAFNQTFTYGSIKTLIGDHTLQEVLDGDIVALQGAHVSFAIGSTLIDRASFLAVIKGLADLTGQTAQTFSIGATNLAKLTAEDIAIATSKNWTIA